MQISLKWLQELVDVTLSPEALAETLTFAGFEVEEIINRRQWAQGVVVGQVLEKNPHPNADKLSVCTVDVGQGEPSTIVCGAPNVRAGVYVPVATPGTYLPAIDLKLKKAKLRGVRSEGMICSLAELGLTKESEGIYIFGEVGEADVTPGQDVPPLLGLDDVVLDLTTTANRADALSMVGVAREVAALTGASLRLPAAAQPEIPDHKTELALNITEDQACPAYIGTVIEKLTIAESPNWLKWRLQSAGVRPINNVVDITNYILLEWGQPLHAFDRERLRAVAGSDDLTIGVRFAKEGKTLKTLDGQERKLKAQNLLITANDKPIALGGVMGGEETEVHEGTQNIVLEAALFDPVAIRRSARSQSLRTEASARYERGVNQAELQQACNRAIALITELAGGQVLTQEVADTRPDPASWTRKIELRLSRVHEVLGQVKQGDSTGNIPTEEVERILTILGCQLESTNTEKTVWTVTVPPYRYRDLEREIDLIEEVARLYGYDRFCDTLPKKTQPGVIPARLQARNQLRTALRGIGLTEVVHYSLVKPESAEIVISNPLFSEYSALRTDLLGGLIDAFAYNLSQGNGALNAYEIGRVFHKDGDHYREQDWVAGILGGDYATTGTWTKSGQTQPLSWYEAKGLLDSVFSYFGLNVAYTPSTADERLHPGRTAELTLNSKSLGQFGQLHPQFRQERDLPEAVYVFKLDLAVLLDALTQENLLTRRFEPFSSYPAVERDLAFFAPLSVTVAELEAAMRKAGGTLLDSVQVFDEYKGETVPAGERSLAFSLAYRSGEKTLKDTDVEPVHQKIRDTLVKQFHVNLRS
jgi:phenylalanyl-tRNA synthetase beta chain